MNVDCMVYPVRHLTKPSHDERAQVLFQLQRESLTYHDLLMILKRGYAVCPGILEDGFSVEDWKSQQLFFVDVDNEESNQKHSVDDNRRLCEKLKLVPISIYSSFSYTSENQRHHLVFSLSQPISDPRLRIKIQMRLNQIFGGDMAFLQANYFFFGGLIQFFPNYYPMKEHLIHSDCALFTDIGPIPEGK